MTKEKSTENGMKNSTSVRYSTGSNSSDSQNGPKTEICEVNALLGDSDEANCNNRTCRQSSVSSNVGHADITGAAGSSCNLEQVQIVDPSTPDTDR